MWKCATLPLRYVNWLYYHPAEGLQFVFVCVLSRKIWSTLLFVLYKMQLRSWFWIVKYVVHGDYSNKHKLGRGFVVVVHNVVTYNSYDLLSSVVLKKNKRQQNKWKIFCFMRNAWMRFESYHGNFGLFLTQSLWRLGFFLSLIVLSHASERAFFFLCVPQKKDHTDFERHECEKIMTGYLLVMWNITAMSVFGQLKMAVRSIFPWGFKKGLDCIQPPKVTINPIYDQTESSS